MKLWITPTEYVNLQEPESLSQAIATRQRSIDFIGSMGTWLPNPDPVLKKMGKDIAVYRELLSDAHLTATVQSRKSGILHLEWAIDRAKSKSRQAQIIQNAFANLDIYRIINEILDAPLFGFSPLEVMWEKVGEYILPKDVVGKPAEWFTFSPENELRFRSRDNFSGEPLPPRKFLLARFNASYQNPYGEALLSRCFWPITFKRGGLKFWITFTEKYGMPYMIGKHPRGTRPDEQDKLLDMLERMIQDAVAVIPNDSSVEILEMSARTSSAEIYERLLTFCNMEISKAILGQTLTTEMQSTGSFAAAKVHSEVREDIIISDKQLVENTLNQLIEWIYAINFGDTPERAKFTLYEESAILKDLAERDKILTDMGVSFSRSYFIKEYGFDEEDLISPAEESPGSSFREGIQSPVDSQAAIDAFSDSIVADSPELQKLAEEMLKPVIALIQAGKSYEDVLARLAGLFPEMNDRALEDLLRRAIFLAESWGRVSGKIN